MIIFDKTIENLTAEDIENLIRQNVAEKQNLEYKREPYGNTDKQKKEMLRDISSMANAFGGYLIIGIEENKEDDNVLPISIVDVPNAENERDRMQSSCLSNFSPRINSLKFQIVEINPNKVLVIFIPRTTNSPHMITYKGIDEYWKRHDRQKSPMSSDELREAFLRTENITQNLLSFLEDRDNLNLINFSLNSYFVIGASPISIKSDIVDINDQNIRDLIRKPSDQTDSFNNLNAELNLFPVPTINGLKIDNGLYKIEIFKNGYIELNIKIRGENRCLLNRQRCNNNDGTSFLTLNLISLIEYTVNYYRLIKGFIEYLGLYEQINTYMSLYNIEGVGLQRVYTNSPVTTVTPHYGPNVWRDGAHLRISPLQIVHLENPDSIAKKILDRLWNAFGFDNAPLFNDDEKFERSPYGEN